MAGEYVALLRQARPQGPYLLGGQSLGGLLAFEMACQLQSAGEKILLLAMADTFCPRPMNRLTWIIRWSLHGSRFFWQASPAEKVRSVRRVVNRRANRVRRATAGGQGLGLDLWHLGTRTSPEAFSELSKMSAMYRPGRYAGDLLYFRADPPYTPTAVNDWRRWIDGTIWRVDLPGNHEQIIREPLVAVLAQHMREHLDGTSRDQAV